MEFKSYIKKYIKNNINKLFKKYVKNDFIRNINRDITNQSQKRVLVSYLGNIFTSDTNNFRHSNISEAYIIIKTFVNLGYVVDVIGCNDEYNIEEVKKYKYDIIFGFGKPYDFACKNNLNSLKIVYLTENSPRYSLNSEQNRVKYYFQRHNKKIEICRSGLYYYEDFIKNSDNAVLLGSNYNVDTYGYIFEKNKIYNIYPTALINNNYKFKTKKYDFCKKNFLWFGSCGAVHKGLDILLDVFKNNGEIKLFIAGLDKSERYLLKSYKECSNIVDCGFIDVQSERFLRLIDDVGFVVLPSASECMSTSVLTCMKHGVIPIVTRNTGFELQNYGFYLEDYKIDYVTQRLSEIANIDSKVLNNMQILLSNDLEDKYELKNFEQDFYNVICRILKIGGCNENITYFK